jgi:hypothetical protein
MKSRNSWITARTFAPLLCLGLGACLDPPVESPTTTVQQETNVRVEQAIKNKVDILFMVDDSPSMSPKQQELIKRFPQLIKVLEDFGAKGNPAWYHIGVVSSDLGSGPTAPSPNCKPGGKGAKLNTFNRCPMIVTNTDGSQQCSGTPVPCNLGTVDGNPANFINFNQLDGSNNLPAGKTLADTFGCIAATGDTGCGFEHQLEASYRALHDQIPENAGFFRNGTDESALLVVVLVTDEDDCSADPTTDLFDVNKVGAYGLDLSYRCTQYGIICDEDPNQPPYSAAGPFGSCRARTPAEGGKLIDVQKYIDYYTKPAGPGGSGGAKVDPRDVIVVSITAPPSPVSSIVANPGNYSMSCMPPLDPLKCAVLLQHSCFAPAPLDKTFFGDPAVRINQVVSAVANHQTTSICDTDYTSALQNLGTLITSFIGAGCLTSPVTNLNDPDCVVEDVTDNGSAPPTINTIPSCLHNNNTPPCWKLEVNPKCDIIKAPQTNPPCAPQQYGVHICRDAMCSASTANIPPHTTAHVSCATVANPPNACP